MERRAKKVVLLVGLGGLLVVASMVSCIFFLAYAERDDRRDLLETGIPAEATIIRLADTGNRFNRQPEVRLWLEVRGDGAAPWEAATEMVISPVHMPQYQPGARVSVRYDPEDPARVAITALLAPPP